MYVFMPEHFYVANFNEVRVFSRTCFCRGVRFSATQGQWTPVETHSICTYSARMHWLHILFINTRHKTVGDGPNALVFRESDKIILEITQPIEYGALIQATFHDISLDDILSITEYENNSNTTVHYPVSGKFARRYELKLKNTVHVNLTVGLQSVAASSKFKLKVESSKYNREDCINFSVM